ncbi:MAG: hypothetical protein H6706_12845 [Myxococcales bacterium]|nr:hypothetical protein [Myxococcales bacterium]
MRLWKMLVLTVGLPGCGGGGCENVEGPCVQDRQGCASSGGLTETAECDAEPALSVELGTGRSGFVALAEGELPPLFYGPQGGVHLFGSVRVFGAQLDRYNSLELRFTLEVGPATCPDGPCGEVREERTVLLEGPLNVTADGTVEEPGFVVFADAIEGVDGPIYFRVQVTDPCGRVAEDVRRISGEEPEPMSGPEPEPMAPAMDWVFVVDASPQPTEVGTPGADICGLAATCDGAAIPTLAALLVLGDGEVCDEQRDGCPTVRGDPDAARDDGAACTAASSPSDYVSLGVGGLLAVRFGRDLRGCVLEVVEAAGADDDAYDVFVCDGGEVGSATCVADGQPLGTGRGGGGVQVTVP